MRSLGAMVCLVLATAQLASADASVSSPLVVHEWGTFTSVSGEDGVALDWRPLDGPSDLPRFVHTVSAAGGRRGFVHDKGSMHGTLRMETPVLYFYSDRLMKVSARVSFRGGNITEWYPQAQDIKDGDIDWGTFFIQPPSAGGGRPPVEDSKNPYYAARAVDAATIQSCGETQYEWEKFLFYRGVGTVKLPLEARLDGDRVHLRSRDGLGRAFVYEQRDGKRGFRVVELGGGETVVERPPLVEPRGAILDELEERLTAEGLYVKEARAMIATWRDTWFEDGLRVFYILPRTRTDEILPLAITPKPASIVRVLVGRVELLTPERERHARAVFLRGEPPGRFDQPVLARLLERTSDPREAARLRAYLAYPATTRSRPE